MALATYVVHAGDWDESAGPTGYENARLVYGQPFADRTEAQSLLAGEYDDVDGVIVELDRGEECPAPWRAIVADDPQETFAHSAAELAEFWARVPADRRLALDIECGGLIQVLDAFRNAHAALPADV